MNYNREFIDEMLNRISLKETDYGYDITMLMSTKELSELCLELTKNSPYTQEGFNFWHKELEYEDKLKVLFGLEEWLAASDDLLMAVGIGATMHMVQEAFTVPCMIGRKIYEEDCGYLEACEEVLDFYLPQDEYDKLHEEAHEVLETYHSAISGNRNISSISKN